MDRLEGLKEEYSFALVTAIRKFAGIAVVGQCQAGHHVIAGRAKTAQSMAPRVHRK